ncbi:hypothetical protein, partial [Hominenteromicrobium sp.]|uniref:hypothetical protein n=1 Tax=Hominenteromicrobium sp. TaxID=3073581 RepID=UPI003993E090
KIRRSQSKTKRKSLCKMLEIKIEISILVYHTEKEGAISRFFPLKKRVPLYGNAFLRYNL